MYIPWENDGRALARGAPVPGVTPSPFGMMMMMMMMMMMTMLMVAPLPGVPPSRGHP